MTKKTSQRMTFVDALRGLAALGVVITHAGGIFYAASRHSGDLFDQLSTRVLVLGHGVDVFFVISGFVIAHSIADAKVNRTYAGRFALRRSLRLDPPYWMAIFLTIFIALVRQHIGHEQPPLPTLPQLVAHLFYAQAILGYPHIIIVFWTLCLEVQFYLVFVLLIWASDKIWFGKENHRTVRAWVTAGAFLFSLLWAGAILPTRWTFSTWFGPQWHKFLIGALIWYAAAGYLPRWMLYVPVLLLGLVVSLHRFGLHTLDDGVSIGLWVGFATAAAFVIAVECNGMYRWLSWRGFQFVGRISYSIYLIHVPMITVTLGIQKRLVAGSRIGAMLACVMLIVFSIASGWLMNLLVERPSIRFASQFKPKKDDLAGGIEGPILPEDVAVA